MHRIYVFVISLFLTAGVSAAPMLRVTAIKDARTLVVDGAAEVRLAGVEITNDLAARELLRWSVGTSWVMVERLQDGSALVYRSPDALFVNRELVLRGYARATLPGIEPESFVATTYLGVVDSTPRTPPKTTATAAKSEAAPRTRSGKSPRSPGSRSSAPPSKSTRRGGSPSSGGRAPGR